MKFNLPEKYYIPAEEICKMGFTFKSEDLVLNTPFSDLRVTYSPEKRLFKVEEIAGPYGGPRPRKIKHAPQFDSHEDFDEILSTESPRIVDNFLKFWKVKRKLSEDAQDWLESTFALGDWDTVLQDLSKNANLTEEDCKLLGLDYQKSRKIRSAANLGLI